MKNYRPYQKINPELLGAKLKSKKEIVLTIITSIDFDDDINTYLIGERWHNNESLFNNFVFADTGLPVGEEEELELIKDKPYILRNNNVYNIRYFSHKRNGNNYFFMHGLTSLNYAGDFIPDEIISEYTPELWEQYKNK